MHDMAYISYLTHNQLDRLITCYNYLILCLFFVQSITIPLDLLHVYMNLINANKHVEEADIVIQQINSAALSCTLYLGDFFLK